MSNDPKEHSCEFVLFADHAKFENRLMAGDRRKRIYQLCGAPSVYRWTSRIRPDAKMWLCKEHGEGMAGNFLDELNPRPAHIKCPTCGRIMP